VTLRQAGATGAEAGSLVTTGQALVAVRNWTFMLGPDLIPALNALLLGYLMYRSGLVPRLIPTLGLTGAPMLIASTTTTMFGINHELSAWTGSRRSRSPRGSSLGIWLIVKGFKPSPITVGMVAVGSPPGHRDLGI